MKQTKKIKSTRRKVSKKSKKFNKAFEKSKASKNGESLIDALKNFKAPSLPINFYLSDVKISANDS